MTQRTTLSLDTEAYDFLQTQGGANKSAFISELLKREKRKKLQEAITKANEEEADDIKYQQEYSMWDITLEDGLSS